MSQQRESKELVAVTVGFAAGADGAAWIRSPAQIGARCRHRLLSYMGIVNYGCCTNCC